MPDGRPPLSDELKLDPKNLDASLRALEEHIVGLKIERTSAQTALRAHSEFVTMIAHEVRTSLGAIFAFADLLLDTKLEEQQHEYADNLRTTADGLLHLLDEVLDHTRLTEGRMVLSIRPFRLNELIASFALTLEARCAASKLAADISTDDDLPVEVEGDSMRIRQVLVNFADNAVRFTETGTIGFRVERVASLPDAVRLRFTITDTGRGFDENTREHLFEPYEQGEGNDAQTHGGSGLGLSICARLVELMGGEIGCESTPGEGSRFWFDIALKQVRQDLSDDEDLFAPSAPPATTDRAAVETAPADGHEFAEKTGTEAETQPAASGPLRTARPCHILVVEDKPVDQMLIATYLKKFGHSHALARNGYEAIEMIEATKFDLILMDLQLPELDGFKAATAIRRLGGDKGNVPIIAITANALHYRRQTWKEADMDSCLSKPLDALQLFKAIAHFRDHGREMPKPPPDLIPGAGGDDDELFGNSEELV